MSIKPNESEHSQSSTPFISVAGTTPIYCTKQVNMDMVMKIKRASICHTSNMIEMVAKCHLLPNIITIEAYVVNRRAA